MTTPRPRTHEQIEQVPCPFCGALAGEQCTTGARPAPIPHRIRRDAAADAGTYVPGGREVTR